MHFQLFKQLCFTTLIVSFAACAKEADPITIEPQTINANITVETTLEDINDDPNAIDYIVTKSSWTIQKGLTIAPGVVIVFEADTKLTVDNEGYLIAKGTASKPILFTGKEKTPGFWRGICFLTVDTRNELTHCTIEYGGGGTLIGGEPNANVGVCFYNGQKSTCKINNTIVQHSKSIGIHANKLSEILEFKNNSLKNNAAAALSIGSGNADILDNSSSFTDNNGYNGVELQGGRLEEPNETTWKLLKNGTPYKLLESIQLYSGLLLEPGVTIEVAANVSIKIEKNQGFLTANGTPSQKITIQGFVKSSGFWKGIVFESNDLRNILSHCTIEHGGSTDIGSGLGKSNIALNFQSAARVENCLIQSGGGCGISKQVNTQLIQTNNTFLGLAGNNVCQ